MSGTGLVLIHKLAHSGSYAMDLEKNKYLKKNKRATIIWVTKEK